ncbi:MAG: hypothetical protein IJJ26_11260 [Victivallales bacterium]|nr:hypothetical protein [Victivallales bacterium]
MQILCQSCDSVPPSAAAPQDYKKCNENGGELQKLQYSSNGERPRSNGGTPSGRTAAGRRRDFGTAIA